MKNTNILLDNPSISQDISAFANSPELLFEEFLAFSISGIESGMTVQEIWTNYCQFHSKPQGAA